MRKTFTAAAAAASVFALPASAATLVSVGGAFAAPGGDVTFDFNSAAPPPFFTATYDRAGIVVGDVPNTAAQPGFSDGSQYAAIVDGGSIVLQSALAFTSVSFFVGSVDLGNSVDLLDVAGNVFASFSGEDFSAMASGDQESAITNRRVTVSIGAGDPAIAGVRFASTARSFELDNVVFAVPESSTWALMLLGFGMVGAATRYRRRKSSVSFA